MAIDQPPYFAAHCEIQDAAVLCATIDGAAGAATIELAKILTCFETQIDDDWRASLIRLGGALFKMHDNIERRHG